MACSKIKNLISTKPNSFNVELKELPKKSIEIIYRHLCTLQHVKPGLKGYNIVKKPLPSARQPMPGIPGQVIHQSSEIVVANEAHQIPNGLALEVGRHPKLSPKLNNNCLRHHGHLNPLHYIILHLLEFPQMDSIRLIMPRKRSLCEEKSAWLDLKQGRTGKRQPCRDGQLALLLPHPLLEVIRHQA